MSEKDSCTFGIGMGNGQPYSHFFLDLEWDLKIYLPTFGIGKGNDKSNSQGLGLRMVIIPKFWEWEMTKSLECNQELLLPLPNSALF